MAAANTSPIYSLTPKIGKVNLVGNIGLTTSDGVGTVGTNLFLLLTGGSNGGTFVSRIRIHAYATAAATNTAATVLRFYASTIASGATTAANTFLIQEIGVGILSAANASTALTPIEFPVNWAVPTNETILVSSHANLASNTGFQIVAISGDY